MDYAIGIDLGGSSVKTVAVTAEGITLARTNVSFDAGERMDWAAKIHGIAEQIQSDRASVGSHFLKLIAVFDLSSPSRLDTFIQLPIARRSAFHE